MLLSLLPDLIRTFVVPLEVLIGEESKAAGKRVPAPRLQQQLTAPSNGPMRDIAS